MPRRSQQFSIPGAILIYGSFLCILAMFFSLFLGGFGIPVAVVIWLILLRLPVR